MIGIIDLGRMRDNVLRRLTRNGHQRVVFHYTTETTTLKPMHADCAVRLISTPFCETHSFNL